MKRILLPLFFIALCLTANAQNSLEDYPDNAEPGKCYARCYIPDIYDFVEERVIDNPGKIDIVTVPAVYEMVLDTEVIKQAYKKIEVVQASYETITDTVMIEPPSTKWVKGEADPACLSADPEDCQVVCLVELPAKYQSISRKILKTPSYTREIDYPAEFKIVQKKVLKSPAKTMEIKTPPTYKTVMNRVLVKKGGYTEWREVLCANKVTSDKIMEIQKALLREGYDPGPIDNILGPRTKEALKQYQVDHSLPIGNLNLETLKALGVSAN